VNKVVCVVSVEMWAFALPLWAYVLVFFCPMGFCPDTNKIDLSG